jgi:hypothetical protein
MVAGLDADAEEVGEAAGVAAGGEDLVDDAVAAQGSDAAGQGEGEVDPAVPDGFVALGVAHVDEHVGVGCGEPARLAVVEPAGEAVDHGAGEWDEPVVDAEFAVRDVGELEVAQLAGGEAVERHEGGDGGACGVGGVEGCADRGGIGREWELAGVDPGADPARGFCNSSLRVLRISKIDRRPWPVWF